MDIEPKLLRELTVTFKAELDDQLQVITDGLLSLEKDNVNNDEFLKKIDSIFRAAHNIKGAARSIGISTIAEIAHQVESIFSNIKTNKVIISSYVINLCLETVDAMRSAMNSHVDNTPLKF